MATGLYDRQSTLHLSTPKNITVVGVGGIGAWVAILAAMSGVKNIYLFDPDVLEESNRNRLPFCEGGLNRPKVEVCKEYITAIRPECTVVALKEKLEGIFLEIQIGASEVIMDCTDSPKAQFSIYNACKAKNRRYIRAGYDGTRIMVTGAVSGWIKIDVEEEAYTINPSWVVPAVTVAALAIGKLMKYTNQEVAGDIGDFGIAVLQKNKRLTPRCTPSRTSTRALRGGRY